MFEGFLVLLVEGFLTGISVALALRDVEQNRHVSQPETRAKPRRVRKIHWHSEQG